MIFGSEKSPCPSRFSNHTNLFPSEEVAIMSTSPSPSISPEIIANGPWISGWESTIIFGSKSICALLKKERSKAEMKSNFVVILDVLGCTQCTAYFHSIESGKFYFLQLRMLVDRLFVVFARWSVV